MKSVAFDFDPNIHHAVEQLLIEIMSPRTLKIAQSGHTACKPHSRWFTRQSVSQCGLTGSVACLPASLPDMSPNGQRAGRQTPAKQRNVNGAVLTKIKLDKYFGHFSQRKIRSEKLHLLLFSLSLSTYPYFFRSPFSASLTLHNESIFYLFIATLFMCLFSICLSIWLFLLCRSKSYYLSLLVSIVGKYLPLWKVRSFHPSISVFLFSVCLHDYRNLLLFICLYLRLFICMYLYLFIYMSLCLFPSDLNCNWQLNGY